MQKLFKTFLEEFRRYSGVDPTELSLKRCEAVYEAADIMEGKGRWTTFTFQNLSIAVEALPKGKRFSHGTMKNDKIVEAFTNFLVMSKTGELKIRALEDEIKNLKKSNEKLESTNNELTKDIIKVEDWKYLYGQAVAAKERYKKLFERANSRLHQYGDYELDEKDIPNVEGRFVELSDGKTVNTETGEIIN